MMLSGLFAIGDVRRADHHLHASLPQVLHRRLRGRRRGAAADQRQMTRAAPRQVVGDRQPEAAETAGDQVAGRRHRSRRAAARAATASPSLSFMEMTSLPTCFACAM